MTRLALLAAGAMLAAGPAEAATLIVTTPDGTAGTVTIHRWDAEESAAPFARLDVPGRRDLPDGSYGIAIGDHPYRLGPIAAVGEVTVGLSAWTVTVPPDAVAAPLGVFEDTTGSLVATLVPPGTVLLPRGRFTIRRDGGETISSLMLSAGEALVERWGALRFAGPVPPEGPVFLLAATGERVVQRLDDPTRPVALPPDPLRIVTVPSARPQRVDVPEGGTLDVPSVMLTIADMAPPGAPLRLADPATGASLAWWERGMPPRLALAGTEGPFDGGPIAIERGGEALGTVEPGSDGSATVWLTPAGLLARPGQPDAIPVAAVAEGPLLPGLPFRIRVVLPERADLAVSLVPDPPAAPVPLEALPAPAGASDAALAIPATIEAGPYRIVVGATLSTGESLTGTTATLPVHRRVAAAPTGLAVADATPTSLRLSWAVPEPATGVAGYNLYRNGSDRPVNGPLPIATPAFHDIGLGAGRALSYVVCGVDALGLEGPCSAPAEGRTLPPD